MVRTERLEVVNTVPPSKERRDKAISAVCGEVFVGLETRKIALKAGLDAAKKRMAEIDGQIKKADDEYDKHAIVLFAEDIKEIKALAKNFKWGALRFTASVNDDYSARLNIASAEDSKSYGGLTINRKGKMPAEIIKLNAARADISKQIYEISMELATVENNIARMPSWKMMVDSAIAKHDLQEDPAGKELYDSVRASFGRMLPAELRSLLPAA